MLSSIIIASVLQILVSFIGIVFLSGVFKGFRSKIGWLVSFAVGTFLGVVFFDLLPEALEMSDEPHKVLPFVLGGFLLFFIISRAVHWYHHHGEVEEHHEKSTVSGSGVLFADFIHNFIDGIVITTAFLADWRVGVITTVAVLIHELPQEASDFFVLIYSGFTKRRALMWNAIVSSTTLLGALVAYFFLSKIEWLIMPLLAIAAGNFLYLAASDLIPGLHESHEKGSESTVTQFALILLGVLVMYGLSLAIGHAH